MESSEIIQAVSKLEELFCQATKNAEQKCIGVTFELFTDGSCNLNFHWVSRSFAKISDSELMLKNLLADINGDNETVKTFDNLAEFQRYLIDQKVIREA